MTAIVDGRDIRLSPEQLAAVESQSRALLVLAGAGSGKTEVVAGRVQRLLSGSTESSGRVLALSYTVKAADEMRDRLRSRVGELARAVDAETVHGYAHMLIRQHGTKIGLPLEPELLTRDEDRVALLEEWMVGRGQTPYADPQDFLRAVDLARARLQSSADVEDWKDALASMSALDFPALLSAARMLVDVRSVHRQVKRLYSHVIVDEAQNLTPAQYDLISSICRGTESFDSPTIMLVGDDKQSIVSFAGADPTLLERFRAEFDAQQIRLTTNFRSASSIIRLADSIALDLGTKGADSAQHAARGSVVLRTADDEKQEAAVVADWIDRLLGDGLRGEDLAPNEPSTVRAGEIAVLGRSATALRGVASALEARTIEFSLASGAEEWLEGDHARVVIELVARRGAADHRSTRWQLARLLRVKESSLATDEGLRQALQDHDPLMSALAPLLDATNLPEFLELVATIEVPNDTEDPTLASWAADVEQLLDTWRAFESVTAKAGRTWVNFKLFCARRQRGDEGAGVQLLTIHKSQGREYRAVAVVGLNDGQLPDFRARSEPDRTSELRAFYVAVTRSRRVLLLTRAKSRQTRYGPRRTDPSPFLRYIEA